MTARLFQISDVDQALPTLTPNYITRAVIAFGTNSSVQNSLYSGSGFGNPCLFAWGAHDELQGAWGSFGASNSIIGNTDTGGSGSDPTTPGPYFWGQVRDNSSSLQGELEIVDFGCANVDINAVNNVSTLLGLLSLAGRTLLTQTGEFHLTGTGLQSITGVGFQPDLVLIGGVEHPYWGAPGGSIQPGGLMFGAAASSGEAVTAVGNQYLSSNDFRTCRTSASRCLLSFRPTLAQASMDSFDPDGFTLDVASFNSNYFFYIAIADTGGQFAVGTGTQGDASLTPGFAPDAIVFAGAGNTAFDVTQQGAIFNMGAADSTLYQLAGFGGGSAAPRSALFWNAKAITIAKQGNGDPVINAQAVATSLAATSNLTWTTNDGSGCKFVWVALKTSTGPGFGNCGLNGQIYRWLKR